LLKFKYLFEQINQIIDEKGEKKFIFINKEGESTEQAVMDVGSNKLTTFPIPVSKSAKSSAK